MSANSGKTWWRWSYLWIALVCVVVLVVLVRVFLPKRKEKATILTEAREGVERLKETATKELKEHQKKMDANRRELENIKEIEDEDERLQALADFGNRR